MIAKRDIKPGELVSTNDVREFDWKEYSVPIIFDPNPLYNMLQKPKPKTWRQRVMGLFNGKAIKRLEAALDKQRDAAQKYESLYDEALEKIDKLTKRSIEKVSYHTLPKGTKFEFYGSKAEKRMCGEKWPAVIEIVVKTRNAQMYSSYLYRNLPEYEHFILVNNIDGCTLHSIDEGRLVNPVTKKRKPKGKKCQKSK
jgi:hypothetical protein